MSTQTSTKPPPRGQGHTQGRSSGQGHGQEGENDMHNDHQFSPGPRGYFDHGDTYEPAKHSQGRPKNFPIKLKINKRPLEPVKTVMVRTDRMKSTDPVANFATLLDEFTTAANPYFGAVRHIHTSHGTRKTKLEDLKPNEIYVIAGPEPFQANNDYTHDHSPERKKRQKKKAVIDINATFHPVDHAALKQYREKSGAALRKNRGCKGLVLRVSINKNPLKGARPVKIPAHLIASSDLPKLLDEVQRELNERGYNIGSIERLYEITGYSGHIDNFKHINEISDLTHNMHVLAVPIHETLNVSEYPVTQRRGIKVDRHAQISQYPPAVSPGRGYRHNFSLNKYPQPLSGITSSQSSPNARSKRRTPRESEVDYDRDVGGVYRAKKQDNAKGAKQVKERDDLQVDRPIDQREAEIVTEEEIYTIKEKGKPIPKGTEVNKQASEQRRVGQKDKPIQDADRKEEVNLATKNNKTPTPDPKQSTDRNKPDVRELTPTDFPMHDSYIERNGKPPLETTPPGSNTTNTQRQTAKVNDEDQTNDDWGRKSQENIGDGQSGKGDQNDDNDDDDQQQVSAVTPDKEGAEHTSDRRYEEYDDSLDDSHLETASYMQTNTVNNRSSTPIKEKQSPSHGQAGVTGHSQREHEMATRIQAGMRGRKVRKDVREMKERTQQRDEEERRQREEEERRREEVEEERRRFEEEERRREEAEEERRRFEDEERRREEEERRRFEEEQERRQEEEREKQAQHDEKRHSAATTIQAGYRGYRVRKSVKKNQVRVKSDKKRKEVESATKIQAGFRGYKTRKAIKQRQLTKLTESVNDTKIDIDNESREKQKAATKIQAGFRGYKSRQKTKAMKKRRMELSRLEEEKQKAAEQANKEKKADAATRIQAGFRGYRTRKQRSMKRKEEQLPSPQPVKVEKGGKEMEEAATKIQAGFRGYQTRKLHKAKVMLMENEDSDSDQYPESARFLSRNKTGQHTHWQYGDLASKVQAAFRGYQARKRMKRGAFGGQIQAASSDNSDNDQIGEAYGERLDVELSKRQSSAMIIQLAYRAYSSRMKMRETKMSLSPHQSSIGNTAEHETSTEGNLGEVSSVDQGPSISLKESSAVKIQACYRGHKARQSNKHKIEKQKSRVVAVTVIQAAFKSYLVRKLVSDKCCGRNADRQNQCSGLEEQVSNADKTLGISETNSVSGDLKSVDASESDTTNRAAAAKIQAGFRGHLSRKSRKLKAKDRAATVLQAMFIGYLVRSKVGGFQKSAEQRDIVHDKTRYQNRDESAIKIQSAFRGHRVRLHNKRKRESKTEAVSYLQAAFQGFIVRNKVTSQYQNDQISMDSSCQHESMHGRENYWAETNIKMIPDAMKQSSALKINAAYKGYISRKTGKSLSLALPNKRWSYSPQVVTYVQACFRSFLTRQHLAVNKRTLDLGELSAEDHNRTLNDSVGSTEVEKEGDSFREVEDEAGELKQLQKNAMVVLHLQAAFRAFKTRKSVNDVLNDKGLLDISKIDMTMTVLKKSREKLREREKRKANQTYTIDESGEWEMLYVKELDPKQAMAATVLQAAFRAYKARKLHPPEHKRNNSTSSVELDVPDQSRVTLSRQNFSENINNDFTRNSRSQAATAIQSACRGYKARMKYRKSDSIIQSQPRNHILSQKSPVDELHISCQTETSNPFPGKKRAVVRTPDPPTFISLATDLQAAFWGYQTRKEYKSVSLMLQEDSVDLNLERGTLQMRSLSETDDMKLKLKSLSKIQAALDGARACSARRTRVEENRPKELESITSSRDDFGDETTEVSTSDEEAKENPPGLPDVQEKVCDEEERRKDIAVENFIYPNSPVSDREAEQAKENKLVVTVKAEKSKADIDHSLNSSVIECPKAGDGTAPLSEKEREQECAVKIQSTYRGFRTRKELKKSKAEKYDQEYEQWKKKRITAATTIQSGWRGYKVRKDLQEQEDMLPDEFSENKMPKLLVINLGRTKEEIDRAKARENAATAVQLVFKASRRRQQLRVKLARRRQSRHELVTSLQASFWSIKTRLELQKHTMATKIQSLFRARLVRLRKVQRDNAARVILEALKAYRERLERKASLTIQSAYRGYRVRSELKLKLQRNEATSLVQAYFRGFRTRQRTNGALQNAYNVTVLQAFFHGRSTRKKIQTAQTATLLQAIFRSFRERREMAEFLKNRHIAVTKLQASFTGMIARRKEIARQEDLSTRNRAASILQAAIIAHGCRLANSVRKNNAALKIQSTYRNYSIRKKTNIRRHKAAVKIQSSYRGRLGRKLARKETLLADVHKEAICITDMVIVTASNYLIERENCAIRIQAAARGYLTRKRIAAEKKRNHLILSEKSAVRIQATFRGYMTRKIVFERRKRQEEAARQREALRKEEEAHRQREEARRRREQAIRKKEEENRKRIRDFAASVIQTALQGKHRRDEQNAVRLLDLQNKAAVKIQALFRGYSYRTDQERERKQLSLIRPPSFSAGSSRGLPKDEELMQNARRIIRYHKKATELQEAFRAYITRTEIKVRLFRKFAITLVTPRQQPAVLSRDTSQNKSKKSIDPVFESNATQKGKAQETVELGTERKHQAASVIQAYILGHKTRMEIKRKKLKIQRERTSARLRRQHESATIIASVYRSYRKRKARISLRAEM